MLCHEVQFTRSIPCVRSENGVEDEEDLYACVYDDEEGGEIYEDLMKTEPVPAPVRAPDVTLNTDPDAEKTIFSSSNIIS